MNEWKNGSHKKPKEQEIFEVVMEGVLSFASI